MDLSDLSLFCEAFLEADLSQQCKEDAEGILGNVYLYPDTVWYLVCCLLYNGFDPVLLNLNLGAVEADDASFMETIQITLGLL